ncbi:uncharacterized protein LOC117155684 [Bombus vancouverensis nearcticus]|uniref:uncharacterized protein LOC117155684 n=1 Tax=Bombus vancouverensis nearcticus TaxID=2705178 RepID=UPI00402B9380
MLCGKVVLVFVVSLIALITGMPQDSENSAQSPFSLPFVQLTNGGIRFNLGGYHAQAGLGGLLGGSNGLHASVGTPWGGHASAGLGGAIDGNNANLGGGLFARAGLGNGRHEAAAGLGGVIDGSGRSGPGLRGGIFANTGAHAAGTSAGISNRGPSDRRDDGNNKPGEDEGDRGQSTRGRSNIQVIARSGNKKEKVLETVAVPAESPEAFKQIDSSSKKEIQEALNVNPLSIAEVNPVLSSETNDIRVVRLTKVLPRHRRRKLWESKRQADQEHTVPIEPQGNADSNVQNIQKRQAIYYSDPTPTQKVAVVRTKSPGFYDDIFQIPISTLNAVNQLLNNNAG